LFLPLDAYFASAVAADVVVCLLGENVVKLLNCNLACDGNFSLVYDDVVDDFICVCLCVCVCVKSHLSS